MVLIHDYLETLAERGRTAPATAKHALAVWDEAIGIEWPLTNPLIASAAAVETNEPPNKLHRWTSKRLGRLSI